MEMATDIALRTMLIGNHMPNAEKIMIASYEGAKKIKWEVKLNRICPALLLCQPWTLQQTSI